MLQADKPDSYVLATNRSESVRDFVSLAFKAIGKEIEWRGQDAREIGVDCESGATLVRINPKFYRPAEVDFLVGDPTKAKRELGWEADTTLEQLCELMVETDRSRNEAGRSL